MDKEIIIDGVNVAECKNFIPIYTEDTDVEINNCCTLTYTHCQKYHENCYYKQLKRAEIEIEKLKGVDGSIHPDSAYYKITRLEQENEGLKSQLDFEIQRRGVAEQDNEDLRKAKDIYYKQTLDDEIQINELLQTLQEIKRIIIQEKVTNNKKLRAILDLITKSEVGE